MLTHRLATEADLPALKALMALAIAFSAIVSRLRGTVGSRRRSDGGSSCSTWCMINCRVPRNGNWPVSSS